MTRRKPIIGITPSPMEDAQSHGSFTRYATSTTYTNAVEAAGGVPVIIPPQTGNLDEILSAIDGIVISGGADIDPQRYGVSDVHPKTYGIHHMRDDLEIGLAREAVERNIPMLCICRGIQILNVALGGSLIQDIPDQYSTEIEHAQQNNDVPKEESAHTVRVMPGTLLEKTYGASMIQVNSFHHQALQDIAPALEINAVAPDEIVESVSCPTSNWILGVQWHPEMMFQAHPEHLQPFQALVAEASKRSEAVPAS